MEDCVYGNFLCAFGQRHILCTGGLGGGVLLLIGSPGVNSTKGHQSHSRWPIFELYVLLQAGLCL